jgi:hypothetical protein
MEVLRFNEQQSDSEKSEPQGMVYLYAGVMLAFRNPRAHALLQDDAERALEVVSFIRFRAKALARTKRQARGLPTWAVLDRTPPLALRDDQSEKGAGPGPTDPLGICGLPASAHSSAQAAAAAARLASSVLERRWR